MKKLFLLLIILTLNTNLYSELIELTNDYIGILLDEASGRFLTISIKGNPENPGDDYKMMLYRKIPPTTLTYLYIDGEIIIYGSDAGYFDKRAEIEENKITTIWGVKGLKISQELSIVKGPGTGLEDSVFIRYIVHNLSGNKVNFGMKIILDTTAGEKDSKGIGIPGIGVIYNELQMYRESIPDYWYVFDDYNNPSIQWQGTINGYGCIKPDRLIISSWNRLFDNPWDMQIDSARELKEPGATTYDTAVALQYEPIEIFNEEKVYYSTMFGIYGEKFFTSKNLKLSINVPSDPKYPPVPVTATILNTGQVQIDKIDLEIFPPNGFTLFDSEKIVTFVKVKTNEPYDAKWKLKCGSVGGTFPVKVKATAIINNNKQSISTEKSFTMNYIEDPSITKSLTELSEVPELYQPKVTKTNIKPILEEKKEVVKDKNLIQIKEEDLLEDIRILDALIADIDKRYQILLGIYQNLYTDNPEILKNIEEELKIFEDYLKKQETILSNQKMILKGK